MSGVAIVGIAAVCAAAIGYERWQVRREARRRAELRRSRRFEQAWRMESHWHLMPLATDAPSVQLCRHLERAVLSGDVASVYRRRFEERSHHDESPFQFRRGRMEAAVERYRENLDTAGHLASHWLLQDSPLCRDPQCRHAVERLLLCIHERLPASTRHRRRITFELIDLTIDVLENTLANLHTARSPGTQVHPFR